MIKYELIKKGVSKKIIEEVLLDGFDDYQVALKAVSKNFKKWQELDNQTRRKKVYEFLTRRGFDFEICKKVFANIVKKD